MKKVVFSILFILIVVQDVYAMRCQKKLVRIGDYVSKMLRLCGKPDGVDRDISINGDTVVYTYVKHGRDNIIVTRDSVIITME